MKRPRPTPPSWGDSGAGASAERRAAEFGLSPPPPAWKSAPAGSTAL